MKVDEHSRQLRNTMEGNLSTWCIMRWGGRPTLYSVAEVSGYHLVSPVRGSLGGDRGAYQFEGLRPTRVVPQE